MLARRYVGFHAYYWFDTRGPSLFIKLNSSAHGAMVGDSNRVHSFFLDVFYQLRHFGQPVQ